MPTRRQLFAQALLMGTLATSHGLAQSGPRELELTGVMRQVHDPVLAEHAGGFYLFSTGSGISVRRSDDLLHWEPAGQAFVRRPGWARPYLPSAAGAVRAPDISHFGGQYHLYYSVSTFGSNVSVIGLATNPTLDPDDPAYAWTDHGPVIASQAGDDWNAIDPNVIVTPDGAVWLSFGSFWSGIMLVRTDASTGLRDASDQTLYALAGSGTLLVGPSERWPGSGHNAVVRERDDDGWPVSVNGP